MRFWRHQSELTIILRLSFKIRPPHLDPLRVHILWNHNLSTYHNHFAQHSYCSWLQRVFRRSESLLSSNPSIFIRVWAAPDWHFFTVISYIHIHREWAGASFGSSQVHVGSLRYRAIWVARRHKETWSPKGPSCDLGESLNICYPDRIPLLQYTWVAAPAGLKRIHRTKSFLVLHKLHAYSMFYDFN